MKEAVSAVLPHVAFSRENPMHDNCPDGEDTWCLYKRDPSSYKYKKGIPKPVAKFIESVFKDLLRKSFLNKISQPFQKIEFRHFQSGILNICCLYLS